MLNLFEKYFDWIDDSIYDGLSEGEADDLENELIQKYGLSHVLKKDAPPEAVKAWKEDGHLSKEAWEKGIILD